MAYSTPLLISRDPSLIDAVNQVADSIAPLRLETVAEFEDALPRLQAGGVALLLPHLSGPAETGKVAHLLRMVTTSQQSVPTVVISDKHCAGDALSLLRLGAADYLDRPLDLQRLAYLIDILTVRARYTAAAKAPEAPAVTTVGEHDPFLYVPATAMGRLMEQVKRIASQNTTVLLTGETGTGKTRLARLIHELSPRREEPFVTVHGGALSANLLESELFGHVKGAFTGAFSDRSGKFSEVGSGTILLDDIDALPVDLQVKLLRVVEEHVFEPVGSNRVLPLRARLIVASNRNLEQEMAAGRLRADLYYRLNVVGFYLPPLREQREVIPNLAAHFLTEFASWDGAHRLGIALAALQALQAYDWPGNVRELRNVIERAVALCPGPKIQPDDLPVAVRNSVPCPMASVRLDGLAPLASPTASGTLAASREGAELVRINEALQRHNNNRLRAAAELGISRMTLYKKLHRYGLMGATA